MTESEAEIKLLEAMFGRQGQTKLDGPTLEWIRNEIDEALKILTFREREIIRLRYGIGDGFPHTLEELSGIFKVTRERIRQVEAKAIRKLQHPVRAQKLARFGKLWWQNDANAPS